MDPVAQDGLRALATIIRHRDCLRLNLQQIEQEFERRGLGHDLSKLSIDEFEGFCRINAAARNHPYGSNEYKESMDREKGPEGCVTLHFSRNSHHPEFHKSTHDMGFLDIIEMVCDWKAAADTYGKTTLLASLPEHQRRFQFHRSQWWLIEQVVDYLNPKED